MNFIEILKQNWGAVSQAPWAFAIMVVAVVVVTWAIANHLKTNAIESLESRLKLRDDEIADYKRKLSGASPDEAKARIDGLETRLNQLAPRRVTAEQREQIRSAVSANPGGIVISSDMAVSDAPALSTALSAAFRGAGWTVSNPSVMGVGNPPLSGLGLRVADPNQLTIAERTVAGALRSAGISIDVQPGKSQDRGYLNVPTDVELLISARVLD